MRVVIAPDKFKGSLSAPEVCRHLETGLQRRPTRRTNLEVLRIPVADGGEGTLDAAVGSGFTRRSAGQRTPGSRSDADYAVRGTRGRDRDGRGLRARRPARQVPGGNANGVDRIPRAPAALPAWAPAS